MIWSLSRRPTYRLFVCCYQTFFVLFTLCRSTKQVKRCSNHSSAGPHTSFHSTVEWVFLILLCGWVAAAAKVSTIFSRHVLYFSTMHTNHREFIHCCHGGGMECPRFVHGFCTDGPFCCWLVCAHASPPKRKCFVVGKTKFGLKVMRNLPYVRTHLKKVYNLIESVWHPFYDSLSGGVSQYGPTRSGHMFVCEKRTSVISCWREGGNRINQRNTRAVRVHSPNKK